MRKDQQFHLWYAVLAVLALALGRDLCAPHQGGVAAVERALARLHADLA